MSETEKKHISILSLFKKCLKWTCSYLEEQYTVGITEELVNDIFLMDDASSQWHTLNTVRHDNLYPIENFLIMNLVLDTIYISALVNYVFTERE